MAQALLEPFVLFTKHQHRNTLRQVLDKVQGKLRKLTIQRIAEAVVGVENLNTLKELCHDIRLASYHF